MYETLLEFSRQVGRVGSWLWTWVFGIALVGGGIWFSVRTGFVQFRFLGDALKFLAGKHTGKTKGEGDGVSKPKDSFSAFQSFCISECSRVGTGNIVGTIVAILMGGPGAIFWMWAMALFGAATNFVECSLGQLHKVNAKDRFLGGPMYYFQKAFKNTKVPSIVVAVVIAFTYGFIFNSIQLNTVAVNLAPFTQALGFGAMYRLSIGLVVAAIVAFVIFGGARRIVKFATILMPAIIITFLSVCFFVILFNIPSFIQAMALIVTSAFSYTAVAGGAVGFTIGTALQQGLMRGLFSNEAGLGTVPIAASASEVSHPVKQGFVQSFGVLLDTIIICSATAFMVLMTGLHTEGFSAVELARQSMTYWIGAAGVPFMTVMLFFLPFTSLVGNYFYGETCMRFATTKKGPIIAYRIGCVLLIVFASVVPLQLVWNISNIFTGILVTFNLVGILILFNQVTKCLDNYTEQRKAFKAGTGGDPTFYDDMIGVDTDYWKRSR